MRRSIGLSGQYAAVDEYLTGRENLVMIGRLYHIDKRTSAPAGRRAAGAVRPGRGGRPARQDLLRGHAPASRPRRRAGGPPPVIFLDEPTTGLDPRSRQGLWDVIEELVREGTTVLLTTQYLDEADKLADSIAVVDRGKVIARGTSDELKARMGGERLVVTVGSGAPGRRPRGHRPDRRGRAGRGRARPTDHRPRVRWLRGARRGRSRAGRRRRAAARPRPATADPRRRVPAADGASRRGEGHRDVQRRRRQGGHR